MIEKIIRFAIDQRWLILILMCGIAALGFYNYQRLAIDAVPDITNVQVQINTETPGYSPLETEQRVTFPLETLMSGLPNLEYTRSLSRYGLSQVTVVFEDGTDIYFARQLVNERIQQAQGQLPPGLEPSMGPIATGLGEIFMWSVEAKSDTGNKAYSPSDLREIQDWIIKPQLMTVPGVTEVNTIGGYAKQYHVTPGPQKLIAYDISFQDVIAALMQNNANVGAGFIEHLGEQYLIRAPGQVSSIEEINNIVVKHVDDVPVYIHDVATVGFGKELRSGAATKNGKEVVLGTVFMLMGENSRTVASAVSEKMLAVQQSLPDGVVANVLYDRTILVDKTIQTVKNNLFEGALLVIAVLFLFLGNIRAALLTALVIPLAMLFTITGMVTNKVSANLMSLGALDFGIIIDGAVVIVENCLRRLAQEQQKLGRVLTRSERLAVTYDASKEVRKALLYGQLIIMAVYIPIFTLTGVEGKMFTPMAFTVVTALVAAAIFTITFIPAGISIIMTGKVKEKENVLVKGAKTAYKPILEWSLNNKSIVVTIALFSILLTGLLSTRMGSEFIPSLDEGDIAMHAMRIPGTSLTQAVEMQNTLEERINRFPEVKEVFAKIGTAEIATDPMPPNVADNFVMLKPRDQWPDQDKSKGELVEEIADAVNQIPGNNYEFTQPIQMRFNELISGVRADVGVKVFGDDMDTLLDTANNIANTLRQVSGSADVKVEQVSGLPIMTIHIRRDVVARYGLNVADVQDVIEVAMGGLNVGQIFQGDRRFDLHVRLPENLRADLETIRQLPVNLPGQREGRHVAYVPLKSLANIDIAPGPNQISRENGKRRIVVTSNVRGRDLGSFVKDAQQAIRNNVSIPNGYWIDWGGQFEQLISATKRLQIVVPIALLIIFVLLFMTFGNIKEGLLVFTGVPFALTGGLLALWLRDMPLSISAGVGFIALSGVAVLNGLVMVTFIKNLRENGMEIYDAVLQGAVVRLRPVMMTALVAALGFVPMALATGTGAEVQKPLATVVIGGIMSSTLLTLLVLPVIYYLAYAKQNDA